VVIVVVVVVVIGQLDDIYHVEFKASFGETVRSLSVENNYKIETPSFLTLTLTVTLLSSLSSLSSLCSLCLLSPLSRSLSVYSHSLSRLRQTERFDGGFAAQESSKKDSRDTRGRVQRLRSKYFISPLETYLYVCVCVRERECVCVCVCGVWCVCVCVGDR